MKSQRLTKRHKVNDKRIRCTICGSYIGLYESINVDISHTLTHRECGHYLKLKETGTLKEVISRNPKWFSTEELV